MKIFKFLEEKPKVILEERTKKISGLGSKTLNHYGTVLMLVMATKTHQATWTKQQYRHNITFIFT